MPHAITLAGDYLAYGGLVSGTANYVEASGQTTGWLDFATLDATVTLGAWVVAVRGSQGRLPGMQPWAIGMIVVATTVTAYFGDLLPSSFHGGMFFYLALSLPLIYQFGAGSEELNRSSPSHLVLFLATAAFGLAIAAVRVSFGDSAQDISAMETWASRW